jgi:polysaccharide export outer membrane protein
VLKGLNPDPVLQADDIVFLPSDAFKAVIKSGGINTLANIAEVILIAFSSGLL